jgi:hydroxymethylbilane synthase
VLVTDNGQKLKDLVPGSVVGTSSLRRAVQLTKTRPDLNVRPIRGNVETRVKKVISGEYDAAVLAEAGLARLGMKDVIAQRFSIRDFVPAPGQGAIAIVCRRDHTKLTGMLQQIEDRHSRTAVLADRALIRKIEGGCRFPVGAVAITKDDKITLYASVFSADGKQSIHVKKIGRASKPEELGFTVANMLVKQGAMDLAQGWRKAVDEWNKKL